MATNLENIYIHDAGTVYPAADDSHMVVKKPKYNYNYDSAFPYRLRGFWHMLARYLLYFMVIILVQPLTKIRYALKIRGKENIRKYKALTDSKGMITVCNHTAEWDTFFVSMTRYFRFAEFPMWQEGAESNLGMLIRHMGGIVIVKKNPCALACAYRDMKNVVEEGKWLHVFPEAACWPFYPAVRNFQSGTFRIAAETGRPVLPMAVKYRAPRGLYKLFKKEPNAEIRIGEPLMPDLSLPVREAAEELCARARRSVMTLLDIESEEQNTEIRNLFPKPQGETE